MTARNRKELAERYKRHKKAVRGSQSEMVQAGQDIGPLPPIARPDHRQEASASLRRFCEIYFAAAFYLAWSPDQLRAIARLEESISEGGLFALAMPRGSGKSALTRTAALWGILTGRRRYGVVIAANSDKAAEELGKLRTSCETNYELIADWPEVLYPILKLDRITQRQRGQTYLGKHTRMTWLGSKLVFPTIAGSKAAGSILTSAGLQAGDIRGQSHQTADGRILRPDFAMIDDPQTRESADSDLQCERRETLLASDVLGMAGPKQKISGVCCCTVIRKGDMADRILDRSKNPMWRGERMKLLNKLPANVALWDQYAQLRRDGGDKGRAATEFYRAHQAEMDAGAEPTWPERFEPDELSAVQFAMNLKIDKPATFASEYQNEPESADDKIERPALTGLAGKTNRLPRAVLPKWATHLVTMVDVQQKALYYTVLAVADDFSAAVIDYATWPEQPGDYFSLREIRRTLEQAMTAAGKAGGVEAAIVFGLESLTDQLFSRAWKREDGVELKIEKGMIDSGDFTEVVYEFCRRSRWGAMLLPSKGVGITAGKSPIANWKIQPHERRGLNYVITNDTTRRLVRLVRFDTNWWKTFVCHRAAVAGGRGSLSVWGADPRAHRMLEDHCTAETCIPTEGQGRKVWEWSPKPGKPDNHFFDTLVGCYVVAAQLGCQLDENREEPTKKKKRSVTYF